MRSLLALSCLSLVSACASDAGTLAVECSAQAVAIHGASVSIKKMQPIERSSIDAQIAQSQGYCSGAVPADPAGAAKAVRASTAQIAATVAIVNIR